MAVVYPENFVTSRKSTLIETVGRKSLYSHTYKGTAGPWAVVVAPNPEAKSLGGLIEGLAIHYYESETEARAFFDGPFHW
jgi:hypothetical protein